MPRTGPLFAAKLSCTAKSAFGAHHHHHTSCCRIRPYDLDHCPCGLRHNAHVMLATRSNAGVCLSWFLLIHDATPIVHMPSIDAVFCTHSAISQTSTGIGPSTLSSSHKFDVLSGQRVIAAYHVFYLPCCISSLVAPLSIVLASSAIGD